MFIFNGVDDAIGESVGQASSDIAFNHWPCMGMVYDVSDGVINFSGKIFSKPRRPAFEIFDGL